jgi:hypothetical protein
MKTIITIESRIQIQVTKSSKRTRRNPPRSRSQEKTQNVIDVDETQLEPIADNKAEGKLIAIAATPDAIYTLAKLNHK